VRGITSAADIHHIIKALKAKPHTITPHWADSQLLSVYSSSSHLTPNQTRSAARILLRYQSTDLPLICSKLNITLPTRDELSDWNNSTVPHIPLPVLPNLIPPSTPSSSRDGTLPHHDFSHLLKSPKVTWITPTADYLGLQIPWITNRQINESLRNEIKGIPGRRWNPDLKQWEVPTKYAYIIAQILDRYFPALAKYIRSSGYIQQWETEEKTRRELSNAKSLEDFPSYTYLNQDLEDLTPPSLAPYPFQKAGVAFLLSLKGSAIIGDEPGLGKTIQALCHWLVRPTLTLIVCPAGVKFNWANEVRRWCPDAKVTVYMPAMSKKRIGHYNADGIEIWTKDHDIPFGQDFVIVNYDNMKGRTEQLPNKKWITTLDPITQILHNHNFGRIILDEFQVLVNWKTQKTQGTVTVARQIPQVIGTSGTPITNYPASFFTILNLVKPSEFPSWSAYINQFCSSEFSEYIDPKTNKKVVQINWRKSEVTNWELLHSKLKTCMIRRMTADVLSELPPLIRQIIKIDVIQNTQYRSLRRELKRLPSLDIISRIRIAAVKMKMKTSLTYILDNFTNEGCVVFYHHIQIGNELEYEFMEAGKSVGRIQGSTHVALRPQIIDEFMKGETDILLLSIAAAGTGINITRTNRVYFMESAWDPSEVEQAEKRVHRIGQKNTVHAIHFLAGGTLEEVFYDRLEGKSQMQSKILAGKETGSMLNQVTDWLANEGV